MESSRDLYRKVKPVLKRFASNYFAVAALGYILLMVALAVFAPYVAPYNPDKINLKNRLSPPTVDNLLGTDALGRDVLSRIIFGSRIVLTVGFVSTVIAIGLGVLLGLLAGYFGGLVDEIIMRAADVFLTLPWLPLVILLVAVFGSNLTNIYVIIGVLFWPDVARIVRPESLSLAQRDFIVAEKVMGASSLRILFRHLLPNQMATITVYTAVVMGWSILSMAAIGFLGLSPITIDWGSDLSQSMRYMTIGGWWLVLFPGLAIFLTCLSFHVVSDALQQFSAIRMRR